MVLIPDAGSARMDPFREEPTLNLTCDVVEPSDLKGYDRDPRSLAKRAEAYLKSSGLGDTAYFGPEPEFFVFDGITWNDDMSGCFVKIKSEEARSEEHTSELQSLMRISYAVFCLKKKTTSQKTLISNTNNK